MKWDGGLQFANGRIEAASPLNIYTAKYGIDEWGGAITCAGARSRPGRRKAF